MLPGNHPGFIQVIQYFFGPVHAVVDPFRVSKLRISLCQIHQNAGFLASVLQTLGGLTSLF